MIEAETCCHLVTLNKINIHNTSCVLTCESILLTCIPELLYVPLLLATFFGHSFDLHQVENMQVQQKKILNKRSPLHNLTYLFTYSMQHSPSWEANRFSASQEIPRILWNPKVHHRIHKWPPPVPILIQINPDHASTSHFLQIHLNIILPSTPRSLNWSISLRFPHRNPVYASPPYVLHAPPISFFSILSPAQYLVRSTDH